MARPSYHRGRHTGSYNDLVHQAGLDRCDSPPSQIMRVQAHPRGKKNEPIMPLRRFAHEGSPRTPETWLYIRSSDSQAICWLDCGGHTHPVLFSFRNLPKHVPACLACLSFPKSSGNIVTQQGDDIPASHSRNTSTFFVQCEEQYEARDSCVTTMRRKLKACHDALSFHSNASALWNHS